MKNVPMPISVIVTRNVYLRPIKSPKWPKISAPNGRTAKPAANVSSAKMKPTFGGTLEKKYFRQERAERAVDVKIVPLEHRPSEDAKITSRCSLVMPPVCGALIAIVVMDVSPQIVLVRLPSAIVT